MPRATRRFIWSRRWRIAKPWPRRWPRFSTRPRPSTPVAGSWRPMPGSCIGFSPVDSGLSAPARRLAVGDGLFSAGDLILQPLQPGGRVTQAASAVLVLETLGVGADPQVGTRPRGSQRRVGQGGRLELDLVVGRALAEIFREGSAERARIGRQGPHSTTLGRA